jgi:molybdate transport repressor ModE-like protein
MRKPEVAVLSGRLLQAHKDLGSVRKAAAEVGVPYATAWRRLQKQGQYC